MFSKKFSLACLETSWRARGADLTCRRFVMISASSNSGILSSSAPRIGVGLFVILLVGLSGWAEASGIEREVDFRGTIQDEGRSAIPTARHQEDQGQPRETINGGTDFRGPIRSGTIKAESSTSAIRPEQRKGINDGDFYLTDTNYLPTEALNACSPGFHMASLWELIDVSNLVYAVNHPDAHTRPDSGQGPPSDWNGWVRTGGASSPSASAGVGNCSAWTSSSNYGTSVKLGTDWPSTPTQIGPWIATAFDCNLVGPVWCVAD